MSIAETPRLLIRRFTPADAAFFRRQLNEPSWIANIGERGVRSVEEAQHYIRSKTLASYREHGFGMYLVELKQGAVAVGMCGLVKRETLPDPDIGFALLEEQWGHGYAEEAARAVLAHAFLDLKLDRLLAITTQTNDRSGRLLEKLGFRPQGITRVNDENLRLYAAMAPAVVAAGVGAPGLSASHGPAAGRQWPKDAEPA